MKNLNHILKHYRLSRLEFKRIKKLLNKEPSRLELALFSALWSEHCSYKSSLKHLKKLSFKNSLVLSDEGENAGVISLGQGEKIAFKVESHNHPSQITPFHGSATGVGGILRDVFIMNARPIALANSLCFGQADKSYTTHLVDGVTRGIGAYGNSIGIPMLTGAVHFHPSYNENILVNALALGYFGPQDKVFTSRSKTSGALLVYAGAKTGRDGIHGASMASESFHKKKEEIKASVQIGDPFYGKLLMEACLESFKKNLVLAGQDMGAAGLISSSFEMISKSGLGMELYLDKVPLRDKTMGPEEILLSESQERVLFAVSPRQYKKLKLMFKKWGLNIEIIGKTIKEKQAYLFWKNKKLLKIHPDFLTKKAPRYERPYKPWKPLNKVKNKKQACINIKEGEWSKTLLSLLSSLNGCSKKFIYQQYDGKVGAKTIQDSRFPFGILRLPHSGRGLSLNLGGRPHIMRMDALEGGKDSIYEPAFQMALKGFKPLAVTDGLNFGSPEKPKIMSEFSACIQGMAKASQTLKTPVVSGNVSFYNETKGKSAGSMPVIGFTGIEKKIYHPTSSRLKFKTNQVKDIYLLSAHQIFCNGFFTELYQNKDTKKKLSFYGSLQDSLCKKLIDFCYQTSSEKPPIFSRVSGKFGLAYALARLYLEEPFFEDKGVCVKTSYDPFQERLYEALIILQNKDIPYWKKKIEKLKPAGLLKMEKLGEVIQKPVFTFNSVVLQRKRLQKEWENGWNLHFKNLDWTPRSVNNVAG